MAAETTARTSSHLKRFEEVYEAYSHLILVYAARRVATPDDAADIVAETFTTAWRRIDELPAGDQARLWLYGVARRVLSNQHRSARRRERLGQRLATQVPQLFAATGEQPEPDPDLQAIKTAFGQLSSSDRELLQLVGWEGLGRDDIADLLGCSRATVRVRLHRARRRFEQSLAEAGVQRSRRAGHETTGWAQTHPDTEEAR